MRKFSARLGRWCVAVSARVCAFVDIRFSSFSSDWVVKVSLPNLPSWALLVCSIWIISLPSLTLVLRFLFLLYESLSITSFKSHFHDLLSQDVTYDLSLHHEFIIQFLCLWNIHSSKNGHSTTRPQSTCMQMV